MFWYDGYWPMGQTRRLGHITGLYYERDYDYRFVFEPRIIEEVLCIDSPKARKFFYLKWGIL